MLKSVKMLGVAVAVSFMLLAAVRAADDPPVQKDAKPPRYKLHVGLELNYAGESEVKFDGGSRHSRSTWKLLVVRQNTDGGVRVFVRYGIQREKKQNDAAEPQFGDEHVVLAWCDVKPDGRVADNPTLDFMLNVRPLLPQLPPAGEATWQAENALTKVREDYALGATADEDHLAIVDTTHGPTDEIYSTSEKNTILFDTKRGFVDQVEGELKQDYRNAAIQTTHVMLKEVNRVDPNLATAVALEMSDYFAVKREYDELIERAGIDPAQTAKLLAQAKSNLEDLRAALLTEVLQKQIDADLAQHDLMATMSEEQARDVAAVLDKPSPDWKTTDLEGDARSIEGCRGKVVVLDFWYRGCGWCIRAMPQIKEVVAHYQGQPVEVLGMNIDKEEADARFVIDKLALNYPTLKAEGLPGKYGVRGFPTLIVIDQAGLVRAFHVGYTPTLYKNVTATIDKLLAETPAAK